MSSCMSILENILITVISASLAVQAMTFIMSTRVLGINLESLTPIVTS